MKIQLPGYLPYETTFTKGVSGWVWGNLLFGGLIGLVVDAASGGLYYLTPEQVAGELRKSEGTTASNAGGIRIFVTMKPDPEWGLLARLERR